MDRFIDIVDKLINVDVIGSIEKGEENWCLNLEEIVKRYTIVVFDKNRQEMHVEIYMTKEERDIIYEDLKRKVMGM